MNLFALREELLALRARGEKFHEDLVRAFHENETAMTKINAKLEVIDHIIGALNTADASTKSPSVDDAEKETTP